MSRVVMVLVMVSALLAGCASDSSKSEAPEQGRDQQVAQLNLQLGINYMRSGDNGQAMEKLQRSLAHDQSNAVTHSTIALLYSRLRDNPKAEHHYQRSIALNPDDSMTRANFGSFLCSRGSYREAVEQYQRAWSNPANRQPEVAYASAGICLSSSGDKVRAEQYLRKALEINKHYPLALMQMAELTFKSKKYLSARAYLQRLGAPAQLGERALYIGFHAENSLGDKEMARRYRGELFKRYPGSEEARKLQGRMMSTEEGLEKDNATAGGADVGRQLQQAREAQEMSVADAASHLRLTRDVVEALEAGSCEVLPTPAFVRGYLRSYARLLSIDEEKIVTAYNATCGEAPELSFHKAGAEQLLRWKRYATFAVVGIVVVLLAIVGSNMLEGEENDEVTAKVEEEPVSQLSETFQPVAMIIEQAEAAEVEHVEPIVAEKAPVVEAPEVAEPEPVAPAVSEPVVVAALIESPPVVTEKVAEVIAPTPTGAVLKLSFTGDSWVVVHDASGKRRMYDMGTSKRAREINGPAPFRVFLGKADVVAVEIDGESFDHRPFIEGDLARFEVGS